MAGKKKQHYVPQLYLGNFTHDGDRLFAYDKFTRKSWPANKTDVGHENYFYEIPSSMISDERRAEGIDEKLIEDGFMEIEGKLGPALEEVVNLPEGDRLSDLLIMQ